MTVSELITELQKFDGNREVLITWEGVYISVNSSDIYTSDDDDYYPECRKNQCGLIIDADIK
jgi:hypothetical protein